jgi:hypothetical protein
MKWDARYPLDCQVVARELGASFPEVRAGRFDPAGGLYNLRNRISEIEFAQGHQNEGPMRIGRAGVQPLMSGLV